MGGDRREIQQPEKAKKKVSVAWAWFFAMLLTSAAWGGLFGAQAAKLKNCQAQYAALFIEFQQLSREHEQLIFENTFPVFVEVKKARPELDPDIVKAISDAILQSSKEYRIDPRLVFAVMKRESTFDPLAKSRKGAIGLMQVMYEAHEDRLAEMGISSRQELYYIHNNVRAGCAVLKEYLDGSDSFEGALSKYVGGNHDQYLRDILATFAAYSFAKHKGEDHAG